MASELGWNAIDEKTWSYEEEGVRFFLVAGSERAALLDSGMATHDARDLAAQLTDLPLMLAHTHCDRDHVGSDAQFDEIWLSPAELVHPQAPRDPTRVRALWDGDVIDLGGRELEVIELPGHTPGSLAFLDRTRGWLFSGDPIQRDGHIFCFGPMRSMVAYVAGLERLWRRAGEFSAVYPCHATCPVDPDAIGELIEGVRAIWRGEVPFSMGEVHGTPVREYDVGTSVLLCDAQ